MPASENRKPDTTKNQDDLDDFVQRQMRKEKHLFPLRITSTTVIYVTKEKCNAAYAERYRRERLGIN